MSTEISCQQLSLPLFSSLSFEEIIAVKKITGFSVKFSTRLKRGWYLNINRHSGTRVLTVPQYMQNAPSDIKISLVEWSLLQKSYKKNTSVKMQIRALENKIQSYISSLSADIYCSALDTSRLEKQTKGVCYDLREVFVSLNNTYFKNKVEAFLRWGSPCSLTSYQTVRMAKDGKPVNLITIAGVYNHPDVPKFALDAVMYHEMLHIVVPPYKKNGRRVIHSPEFKRMERQFAFFEQWCEWEKLCLRALARNMKKKRDLGLSLF
ncbi:MAG: hypothetical protein GX267_06615 [Fibrobacter sp.]|jgi:hypothetical protein|nr:hypothetical protein [Fibrobacter sp.]